MENLKVYKKRAAALAVAAGLAFSSIGVVVADLIYDKNSEVRQENEIGKENINPFFSYKVNEKDFVLLDVGDHNSIGTRFQDKKMTLCNNQDISLGIIVNTNSKTENQIYDDVEYVKGLVRDYDIDFPVYLNIDDIILDDNLEPVMKTKLIKDFLEKCSSNNIYVGVAGTDKNLCRLKEHLGISGYDAYLIMDKEVIEYDGTCNVVKDLDGEIISYVNLADAINKRELNSKEHFVQDGSFEVKDEDDLLDLSLRTGMSVSEICKFNNISKREVVKYGAVLRVPTQTNTGNIGTINKIEVDDYIRGCDMSEFQGTNQNWDKLKENFDFIILRSNQGTDVDSCFEENAKNCNIYNIPMGVYCYNNYYLENCSGKEDFIKKQNNQVKCTLDLLKNKNVEFPVYLDIEAYNGMSMEEYLSPEYVRVMLDIWKANVEEAGYMPGIYCNQYGYNYLSSCVDYDLSSEFEVWIAGGDQYVASKKDLPFETIVPSKVLDNEGVSMAQSTDSAVGAGAGNGKGHLDINFSKVDYEFVPSSEFEIKDFNRIDYAAIGGGCLIGYGGLIALKRRNKKNKEKSRK